MNKFITGIILLAVCSEAAQAQTLVGAGSYVTEIITDYGGYWRSGTGTGTGPTKNAATSTTLPDNSHQLLAFVVNSGTATVNGTQTTLQKKYFSTGVNDALLDSKRIAYIPSQYQALSVAGLSSTITSQTKVALGQLFDGVSGGPSVVAPASGFAQYLTDGTNGLDLGTGVANLPAGTLAFTVNAFTPAAIGDGVPDILITQIASPSDVTADVYQFLDANGNPVAGTNAIAANFKNVPVVGNWMADFYEALLNPMTLTLGFTNTSRPLRLLAVDFDAFGVTSSNYTNIKQFQIKLSGDSDQAFIAYNTNAASIGALPLPVQLVSFAGVAQGSRAHLSWRTASELRSAYFEVEASADGHVFQPVGRVVAAGTSATERRYSFEHQPPQAGLGYYRLRQVDTDGTSHYSPVVAVRTGAAAVAVYPNPTTSQLTVQLPALSQGTLTLLAADGRPVWQQQLAAGPGQQLALPGVAALPAGLYLLRAEVDGQAALHRVVKE